MILLCKQKTRLVLVLFDISDASIKIILVSNGNHLLSLKIFFRKCATRITKILVLSPLIISNNEFSSVNSISLTISGLKSSSLINLIAVSELPLTTVFKKPFKPLKLTVCSERTRKSDFSAAVV